MARRGKINKFSLQDPNSGKGFSAKSEFRDFLTSALATPPTRKTPRKMLQRISLAFWLEAERSASLTSQLVKGMSSNQLQDLDQHLRHHSTTSSSQVDPLTDKARVETCRTSNQTNSVKLTGQHTMTARNPTWIELNRPLAWKKLRAWMSTPASMETGRSRTPSRS
jgi:hypothetical protein